MKPFIRPMEAADKPAVMEILRATPEFNPFEVDVAEEVIDGYLNDPSGSGYHTLVAEFGSSIKGYISYGPTPLTEGTWDIYWMAVSREEQGRGIGKTLLSFAENHIKESRGRLILIETSSKQDYEKARRFYSSQGYGVACQIADFYAPGDNLVIFQKRMVPST